MTRPMLGSALLVLATVALWTGAVASAEQAVTIQVQPATINLDAQGTWLTIHAELSRSLVVDETVQLNGLAADVVKADDRGELVAKFDLAAVQAMLADAPAHVTLTLSGELTTGEGFAGSEVVRVLRSRGR